MNRSHKRHGKRGWGLNELLGKLVREPLKMFACLIRRGLGLLAAVDLFADPRALAFLLIRWLARQLKRANRRAMEESRKSTTRWKRPFRASRSSRRSRWNVTSAAIPPLCQELLRQIDADRLLRFAHRPGHRTAGNLTICVAMLAGALPGDPRANAPVRHPISPSR